VVNQLKAVKKEFRAEIGHADQAVIALYNKNIARKFDEYERENGLGIYSDLFSFSDRDLDSELLSDSDRHLGDTDDCPLYDQW